MWNMFKVNNKDSRATVLASIGVFIVNFEHISYFVLVFVLLTLSRYTQAVKVLEMIILSRHI